MGERAAMRRVTAAIRVCPNLPINHLTSGVRSRGTSRPFEVRVGDRVTVRVVRGEAERLVDLRLELLGDHVLEPVGLLVDLVDVDAPGSSRGRARAADGDASPRARPAPPRTSATPRGTGHGRRARAPPASSPSRSRTPGRHPCPGRGQSSSRDRRMRRACRSRAGSPGSRRSASRAPWIECTRCGAGSVPASTARRRC